MKNTYKPFLVFAFFALVFTCIMTHAEAAQAKIKTGIRYSPDTNECERPRGLCFNDLLKNPITIDNSGIAEISVDGESIVLNIPEDFSKPKDYENTITVYAPTALPNEVYEEMGVERVIEKPGVYRVDNSSYRLGSVTIHEEIID